MLYQNYIDLTPKAAAQRNLWGKSYYVDDSALRFHKSRVVYCRASACGKYLYLITTDALDWHNTKRGYRYVIFNSEGQVVDRVDLDQAFNTSKQVKAALSIAINKLEA